MVLRLGCNFNDLFEVFFQVLIIFIDVLPPRLHIETQKLACSPIAKPLQLIALLSDDILFNGPLVIIGEVDVLIG